MSVEPMEAPEPVQPVIDEKQQRRAEANRRRLRRYRILFPFLLLIVFVVWAFTTNYIPSASMEPTLRAGDHIVTMRSWLAYPGGRNPKRGDIIVFVVPLPEDKGTPQSEPDQKVAAGSLRHVKGDILVKRVAGLPGETIQVGEQRVWINGKEFPRSAIGPVKRNSFAGAGVWAGFQPLKLKDSEVFVLGDNPEVSDDSRYWGPLNKDRIIGRCVGVLFHESAEGPNRKFDDKNNGAAEGTD